MSNMIYKTLSHDAIVKALFENYESLYVVDANTSAFHCFHESDSYSSLCLEEMGDDFFKEVQRNINAVYWEDREHVIKMLSKEALCSGFMKGKYYSFVYRLVIDGKPLYHKLRATMEPIEGRPHFLIGIRNIDDSFRQDKLQAEKLSSMHSKELNHLEAVLASAEGYLEINLSKNTILEFSLYKLSSVLPDRIIDSAKNGSLLYSDFEKWNGEHLIVQNKERYITICDREYLINCFKNGDKRATATFTMRAADKDTQQCKMVFYMYQDEYSGDILSFCVLYDLTEQQRKEKELQELEKELQMMRLRNFTSQMQPHFLYNTLGSIQEIIVDDPKYASELIGDFTIHLRSCIRAMANDTPIPFSQELDNIMAYLNIEKMRFGHKLKVVYDIGIKDFKIIPLSVQPIVENAIRHGIYERGEAGGTVIISTFEKDDSICIVVKDDGVGFDPDMFRSEMTTGQRDSTGLNSIIFRLDKMMHASVDIKSDIGVGTCVTITVPRRLE